MNRLALWMWGGVFALACNETQVSPTGPSVGSETHWLSACQVDADCEGEGSCRCGVCTTVCENDAGCAGGACVTPAEMGGEDVCGAVTADTRLCAATCDADTACPDTLTCVDAVCAAPSPVVGRQTLVVPDRPRLDILAVVDDSGSMCEEQNLLGDALRLAAPTLAELDFRFAVVTTDMRSAGAQGRFERRVPSDTPPLNCTDPRPEPSSATCETAYASGLLDGEVLAHDGASTPAALADTLACLTRVGTLGDAYEKGLETMRLALDCQGPQRALYADCCEDGRFNPKCGRSLPFLRPEAGLLVLIASDEADCSDPASNPRSARRPICRAGPDDTDGDGVPDGYLRPGACEGAPADCFQTDCGDLGATECYRARCEISRSDNSNCIWFADELTSVSDYAEFLAGLKPWGARDLNVLPIVGSTQTLSDGTPVEWTPGVPPPACDIESPEYNPESTLDDCCPGGVCEGDPNYACAGPSGVAFDGRRYRELGRMLCGDDCETVDTASVCDSAYDVAQSIDALLARRARDFCLDFPAVAGQSVTLLGPDGVAVPEATWAVVDLPTCPERNGIRFLAAPAPGDYEVRVTR